LDCGIVQFANLQLGPRPCAFLIYSWASGASCGAPGDHSSQSSSRTRCIWRVWPPCASGSASL